MCMYDMYVKQTQSYKLHMVVVITSKAILGHT